VPIATERRSDFLRECLHELRQVVWPNRRATQRGVRAAFGTALIVTTIVAGLNVGVEHGFASLIH
jgi:preprotein translocase SecE subunit